ncbi:MAG: YbfB/YjiJ family MFS transporter [Mesorhizobium sp.]|nr:YbfB/YjiJ family MFS transporter [Mesorhizobium sp.]
MRSFLSSPFRPAVAGLLSMAVAMGIGRFVYTPLLPGMMEELGQSTADAGLIASANYAGYLIGALLASGGWGEGRERAVGLWSLAASALLVALMAAVGELGPFLILRFLAGIASAFVMIFVSSLVFARLMAAGREDLQALHFSGVGLGIVASAIMTGLLHIDGAPWRAGWIWAGILSVAGLCAVWLLLDRGAPRSGAAAPEPPLVWSRPFLKLVAGYGLFGFGYIVTATFLVAIVRQGTGGPLLEAWVWLATGLAILPSIWLWGLLVRRRGLRVVFAAGCLVEIVGVVASVLVPGMAGPLIAGVLLGGTFVAVTAFGLQAGRKLAAHAPRRALALMTASFGTGQILGPIAAGFVADRTGDFVLASLLAAAALLLSALLVLSSRHGAEAT